MGESNFTPEKGGVVEEAIKLGGVVTKIEKYEKPQKTKDEVIEETMSDGKKVIITEDGTQFDGDGNVILEGSEPV